MAHKRTVLVIDGDTRHRDVFVKTVRALGHEATGAASSEGALQLLHERPFDMVLVDVNMPGIDGIAITRSLRAAPIRQPVVLGLLADEDEDVFDACIEAGMDGVISKIGTLGLLRKYLPQPAVKKSTDVPGEHTIAW